MRPVFCILTPAFYTVSRASGHDQTEARSRHGQSIKSLVARGCRSTDLHLHCTGLSERGRASHVPVSCASAACITVWLSLGGVGGPVSFIMERRKKVRIEWDMAAGGHWEWWNCKETTVEATRNQNLTGTLHYPRSALRLQEYTSNIASQRS